MNLNFNISIFYFTFISLFRSRYTYLIFVSFTKSNESETYICRDKLKKPYLINTDDLLYGVENGYKLGKIITYFNR